MSKKFENFFAFRFCVAFAPLPVWAFLAGVAKTFVNAPAPKNTSVMRVKKLFILLSFVRQGAFKYAFSV